MCHLGGFNKFGRAGGGGGVCVKQRSIWYWLGENHRILHEKSFRAVIFLSFFSIVAPKMTEFIWRNSLIWYSCQSDPCLFIFWCVAYRHIPFISWGVRHVCHVACLRPRRCMPPPLTNSAQAGRLTRPVWKIFLVAVINKLSKFYYYRRLFFFSFEENAMSDWRLHIYLIEKKYIECGYVQFSTGWLQPKMFFYTGLIAVKEPIGVKALVVMTVNHG